MHNIGDKVYYIKNQRVVPANIVGTYQEVFSENGNTTTTIKYSVAPNEYPDSLHYWEYADSEQVFDKEDDAIKTLEVQKEEQAKLEQQRKELEDRVNRDFANSRIEELKKKYKGWNSLEELEKVLFDAFIDGSLTLKTSVGDSEIQKYMSASKIF